MKIDFTLTFHSSHNIGSGLQQGTLAKQPLLKSRSGWPYIPASTLKGRVRHATERVAQALDLHVCQTHHAMCRQAPCLVCSIFGAPWQAGGARFHDLQLSGPQSVMALRQRMGSIPPESVARPGVAINRRRGTAEPGLLFSTEIVFDGVPLAFSGTIDGELSLAQVALLVAGLQELYSIGRAKSRGLGWFELQVDSLTPPVSLTDLQTTLEALQA